MFPIFEGNSALFFGAIGSLRYSYNTTNKHRHQLLHDRSHITTTAGMTYVDVPSIPGISSRGSSLSSSSPGDNRGRQLQGEGGNISRGGFATNLPGSSMQRGMEGSSRR